jgi:hypothetical protein
MKMRFNRFNFLALAAIAVLIGFMLIGCSQDNSSSISGPEAGQSSLGKSASNQVNLPVDSDRALQPDSTNLPVLTDVGPAWEGYIVSEAFYALSQSRNGGSSRSYNGYTMSDWPYPLQGDCCNALGIVTNYMYGGNIGLRGPLGLWLNQYQQGGQCKFFVNLVLYRSSYGYPGGHLVLTPGYSWSPSYSVYDAQPGWIIQSPSLPHTAIVVSRLSNGLDVVDANWIGGNGSYAIGRHPITWSTLNAYGFRAYRAHQICRLL